MDAHEHIRKRTVCLSRASGQPLAPGACQALQDVSGVIDAHPVGPNRIALSYSLQHLTFDLVEGLLTELGYPLDPSWMAYIRRSIYQYLEDNAREKLKIQSGEQKLLCEVEPSLAEQEPDRYWNNYR